MFLGERVTEGAREKALALRDTLALLSGKWNLCIIRTLSLGSLRFKDLQAALKGITPKVLSEALQELEMNHMVTRTVNNSRPITVSYSLTDHAYETRKVIEALVEFGTTHRKVVKGK
jgi:DNA-binding HxlR family transcriptional regulator